MKSRLVFLGLLCLPTIALAHLPALPEFLSYEDIVTIEDPAISQAFYVELTGFPHWYGFVMPEAGELFVEVLVPDISESDDNVGGIIVRKIDSEHFEEIARLEPQTANWESFYEPFGGDSYRRGPSYRAEVPAGEYLIEVTSPTNLGKYTFVIGELEDFSSIGILETMKRIYEVKRFFGKSPIAVIQSPFYSVPLGVLALLILVVWYWRKKKYA